MTNKVADSVSPENDHDSISFAAKDDAYRRNMNENPDGIYSIRSRTKSVDKHGAMVMSADDDPGLRRPGDYKQKQVMTISTSNRVLGLRQYQY